MFISMHRSTNDHKVNTSMTAQVTKQDVTSVPETFLMLLPCWPLCPSEHILLCLPSLAHHFILLAFLNLVLLCPFLGYPQYMRIFFLLLVALHFVCVFGVMVVICLF